MTREQFDQLFVQYFPGIQAEARRLHDLAGDDAPDLVSELYLQTVGKLHPRTPYAFFPLVKQRLHWLALSVGRGRRNGHLPIPPNLPAAEPASLTLYEKRLAVLGEYLDTLPEARRAHVLKQFARTGRRRYVSRTLREDVLNYFERCA